MPFDFSAPRGTGRFLRRVLSLMTALVLMLPGLSRAEDAENETLPERMLENARLETAFASPGSAPYADETQYISENLVIRLSSAWYQHSDVYVADIRIATPECFRRAFGGERWNRRAAKVAVTAAKAGAVLAMTGDNSCNLSVGMVVTNGTLRRSTLNRKRDLMVMYKDGRMETFRAAGRDMNALYADLKDRMDEIWQVFLFGPSLLDEEGNALTAFTSDVKPANPRSVIGYYGPGHYCFVQVDGRGVASALSERHNSRGLTLEQLSALMQALGCKAAYNLDGGQSSMLWFSGALVSTPYKNGRKVDDIVCIIDPAVTPLAEEEKE